MGATNVAGTAYPSGTHDFIPFGIFKQFNNFIKSYSIKNIDLVQRL